MHEVEEYLIDQGDEDGPESRLKAFFGLLDTQEGKVVALILAYGMNLAEIAALCEVTPSAICRQLKEAKMKAAQVWGPEEVLSRSRKRGLPRRN